MIHAHRVIRKERGLPSANKKFNSGKQILRLLQAVTDPMKLALAHCGGHQSEDPSNKGYQQLSTKQIPTRLPVPLLVRGVPARGMLPGKDQQVDVTVIPASPGGC